MLLCRGKDIGSTEKAIGANSPGGLSPEIKTVKKYIYAHFFESGWKGKKISSF